MGQTFTYQKYTPNLGDRLKYRFKYLCDKPLPKIMKSRIIPQTIFLTKKIEVRVNQILYIEGDINYAKIVFENDSSIYLATTLKRLELVLADYEFIRIHKKYLINVEVFPKSKIGNDFILLPNNQTVKISRRRKRFVETLF